MKPKLNKAGDKDKSLTMDSCQTPLYALDPLLIHLPNIYKRHKDVTIWEPASGEWQLVAGLRKFGYNVIGTDLLGGYNFFDWQPDYFDMIITNPPYSIKYIWLERCYSLNKPFALLLPIDTIGAAKAQKLFDEHGVEIIWFSPRVNFRMPHGGYAGSAQFSTAWFTWGLEIGKENTYAKINNKITDEEWLYKL